MRDKEAARRRSQAFRRREKIKKYGEECADVNMSGRHGNHARGPKNGRWNASGRLVTSQGYIALRVDPSHPRAWGPKHGRQRYAYEHDLVAEAMLGRPLRPEEVVHHRNGERQDNRPANLAVETRSDHAREHGGVVGARDSLGRFAPETPRVRDSHGGDMEEWPEDLRVREFPQVVVTA